MCGGRELNDVTENMFTHNNKVCNATVNTVLHRLKSCILSHSRFYLYEEKFFFLTPIAAIHLKIAVIPLPSALLEICLEPCVPREFGHRAEPVAR